MVHQPHEHFEEEDGDSHADDLSGVCHRDFPSKGEGDFNWRVEISPFDGLDASGWLIRIDCYFRISGIPVGENLEYVVLALHGKVLMWFEWRESQSSFYIWLCFKQDLLKCFELGAASNPLAPLLLLDIKSIFLHGEINEDVYLDQSLGYMCQGREHQIYKLEKALYGL